VRRFHPRPHARVHHSHEGRDFHDRRIRNDPPGLSVPRRLHSNEGKMISHRTLATAMFVAAGVVGGKAAAASLVAGPPLPPNDAKVTALSVVPNAAAPAGGARADVVIRVDGAITFKHFTMTHPDKIVVDLAGASLGMPGGDSYDGVARGGITRVR